MAEQRDDAMNLTTVQTVALFTFVITVVFLMFGVWLGSLYITLNFVLHLVK
jgi:hypothetical protein